MVNDFRFFCVCHLPFLKTLFGVEKRLTENLPGFYLKAARALPKTCPGFAESLPGFCQYPSCALSLAIEAATPLFSLNETGTYLLW